jgi:hypothetical protein
MHVWVSDAGELFGLTRMAGNPVRLQTEIARRLEVLMHGTSIIIGICLVCILVLLLFANRLRLRQLIGARSQRMCPFCGMITSAFKPLCLECGKPLRIERA